MKFERIDHVGVIVADLDTARGLLEEGFGFPFIREVRNPELRSAFFKCGNAEIELIEILDPDLRHERLGEGRAANVEHIAIEVDDIAGLVALLATLGIKTTGAPQVSQANTSVWTVAGTSGGVMYQFLQKPRAGS
jgi:catechol 2,3-dioxygenase-like lactoylglutathione lyase family enzyme